MCAPFRPIWPGTRPSASRSGEGMTGSRSGCNCSPPRWPKAHCFGRRPSSKRRPSSRRSSYRGEAERDRRLGDGDRARGPLRAEDDHQIVLWMSQHVRERAQYQCVPGMSRFPRLTSCSQPEHSVDDNRSGVPLVEIVSCPDLRTSAQARAYVTELRSVLVATGASDGKMEEGSMRVDANVLVRRSADDPFGTRCEIKNLNSVRSVGRAIDYEAGRQIALIESGEQIMQQTRHWDEDASRTVMLRSKEDAYDYRYFLEPDLVPLVPEI